MRVVFRADAATWIGTGHVMRCLALAEELRARGAECEFICRDHEGNLIDHIRNSGHKVQVLSRPQGMPEPRSDDYESWLSVPWERDAAQTAELLAKDPADWLVVDHYALDARWESELQRYANRFLVIDDLANRKHECTLLLDYNAGRDASDYSDLVAANCAVLAGPEYALLAAEYHELRAQATVRSDARTGLVYLGGGYVESSLVNRIADALEESSGSGLAWNIFVRGGATSQDPAVQRMARLPWASVHDLCGSLAPWVSDADVAIGAAGVAALERCVLGLPTLMITVASNQEPGAVALDRAGAARLIGSAETVSTHTLHVELQRMITPSTLQRYSRAAMAVTDGGFTALLASLMAHGQPLTLCARPAGPADESLLLQWANDTAVRANSFSTGEISAAEHSKWFAKRLAFPDECAIFVVEVGHKLPVGQVRFDRQAPTWLLDYTVAPAFRGLGLAQPMLRAACSAFFDANPDAEVTAMVKAANESSVAALEHVGRRADQTRSEADIITFHLNAESVAAVSYA